MNDDAGLDMLNAMDDVAARAALLRCCGSVAWVDGVLTARPFSSRNALLARGEQIADTLTSSDWLEAFSHHPRIGDRAALSTTASWEQSEQGGVTGADNDVLDALAAANETYEQRFGYIFLVCATGKGAEELLQLLHVRLNNEPAEELHIAAAEQRKITALRIDKLLEEGATP